MNKILLLDGGFSNELCKITSYDLHNDPLWTAKALNSEPQLIIDTHLAYLKAGADIIETSSYQATIRGFSEHLNLTEERSKELLCDSVKLAQKAVKQFVNSDDFKKGRSDIPLIAGSIGPFGIIKHDGSEYTGNYMDSVTTEEVIDLHLPRLKCLVESGVDILAIETFPSLKEAKIVLDLVQKYFPNLNQKVWISFSVKENGDSLVVPYESCNIVDAYKSLSKYNLWGFGINCCYPNNISTFLKQISSVVVEKDKGNPGSLRPKILVYPNSGQDWVRGTGWINNSVPTLETYVQEWMELGADIIGGCCQIGVETITKLRVKIDEWNSKK